MNEKKYSCLLLAFSVLIPSQSLYAAPWTALGPRALGMGGAYTAIAEGPAGAYWNPAGLGQPENPSGIQVPAGARGDFTGSVLKGANNLNQIQKDCSSGGLGFGSCSTANIQNALNDMNQPGSGALADGAAGVILKFGRLAVFADEFFLAGATPVVDTADNTALTIAKNTSALILRGAALTELGVGYGHTLGENTGLNLGANLKGIVGKVGYNSFSVIGNNSGSSNVLGHFLKNSATSFEPALDAGLLWDAREAFPDVPWRPRLGVVGRNLNDPKFTQPDAAKNAGLNRFSLQGQGRAGLAISPFHFWNVSADMDLTNNLTPVENFKSRTISLGTEVNVFNRPWLNIPLRAGVMKNVSAGNAGVSWTGGFGLNFLHVVLDAAGSVSDKKTAIQTQGKTQSIPNNFAASAQLSVLFGGREYAPAEPRPSGS